MSDHDDSREVSYPDVRQDFAITVEQRDGLTVVTARPVGQALRCYELFCDADLIPNWLWVVGKAVVQERDDRGRALQVDFIGSLERASIAYTLAYSYDDQQREVQWHRVGGGVRNLAGSARFESEQDERCRLVYTLTSELSENLPAWADELYRQRPAETVVIDFCEWLEAYQG
jgi:hypothetical protein